MQGQDDADLAAEICARWPEVRAVTIVRNSQLVVDSGQSERAGGEIPLVQSVIRQLEALAIFPTLLLLTAGRGNLDMGGSPYYLMLCGGSGGCVLYELTDGHIALELEQADQLTATAVGVLGMLRSAGLVRPGRTGPLSLSGLQDEGPAPALGGTIWYDWYRPDVVTERFRQVVQACRSVDPSVRYVALVDHGTLVAMCSRMGPLVSSDASASDRVEETVINPALLALAAGPAFLTGQRTGPSLIVRYPGLYAVILARPGGHVTLSVDRAADPVPIADAARAVMLSSLSERETAPDSPHS